MRTDRSGNAVAVLALGLLALAAMSGGTSASFTATSVNPNNLHETALLSLSNDKPNDGDLVSVSNLVPGDTVTRSVTITNSGNAGLRSYVLALAQAYGRIASLAVAAAIAAWALRRARARPFPATA